jgi:tRNA dimethylallyltransferase
LLVITGPTAVGKTELAIRLGEAIGGEIISADSRQIYRLMDIGTAKPTPEQRARLPHHLLDVVYPDEHLSLAQVKRLIEAAITAISARGHVPMLVGGTGQYITAVLEGWSIPEVAPDPALRAQLEAQAAEHGVDAVFRQLLERDPAAEAFVDRRNLRRIIRALEVCIVTGQPFSAQRRKRPPTYPVLAYALTMDRERLYAQADRRVQQMIADGFVDEVRALLDAGYDRSLPSMSGLGYAQLAAHLLDGLPLEQSIAATQSATHDFIRRQYTWFRGHDHGFLWHNREDLDEAALIESADRWLAELRASR